MIAAALLSLAAIATTEADYFDAQADARADNPSSAEFARRLAADSRSEAERYAAAALQVQP